MLWEVPCIHKQHPCTKKLTAQAGQGGWGRTTVRTHNCFRRSCSVWVWPQLINLQEDLMRNKNTCPQMPAYTRTLMMPKTQTGLCLHEVLFLPDKFRDIHETFRRVPTAPIKEMFTTLPIPVISPFCSLHCCFFFFFFKLIGLSSSFLVLFLFSFL